MEYYLLNKMLEKKMIEKTSKTKMKGKSLDLRVKDDSLCNHRHHHLSLSPSIWGWLKEFYYLTIKCHVSLSMGLSSCM